MGKMYCRIYQAVFKIGMYLIPWGMPELLEGPGSVKKLPELIKEKGYSLSAGQYFDIKIDYVDITEEEFNRRMEEYKQTLAKQFDESHRLESEIMKQLDALHFNPIKANE